MNIKNFEHDINQTILDRGYDYYMEGRIIETFIEDESQYVFQVEGSEDYEVVVEIDESGDILYSTCDCPYNLGPICKHEVAAYFELSDMLNNVSKKKEIQKQLSINEVLNSLSKEELISILVDITRKDVIVKNSIILRYSKGNATQELEKCRNLMNSIIKKYIGREGYITYRYTSSFADEMEEVLEKARSIEDPFLSLDIAFMMLEESIEAFNYADDSNGAIGSLVDDTMSLIEEIVMDCDDLELPQREKVFHKLLKQSESKAFDGWEEFRIDLLRLCRQFADVEALRDELRRKIEQEIHKYSGNSSNTYSHKSLLEILYEMIEMYGTAKEAEQFVQDHLNVESFREKCINRYMKEKNYKKVIELAFAGEKLDQSYPGLVSKWKKLRYTVYKELSWKEEQAELAKELLFEGDFDYYQDLKALMTGNQKEFYEGLKQELKNSKGWRTQSIYLMLIKTEKDLDALLEFVKEHPSDIESYAERLAARFKDEVLEIYHRHIQSIAHSSSNRKDYQRVCRTIQKYRKVAGPELQENMINTLLTLYQKRPAFVDELSKLK